MPADRLPTHLALREHDQDSYTRASTSVIAFAAPIAHTSINFFAPLFCGDRIFHDLRTVNVKSWFEIASFRNRCTRNDVTSSWCVSPIFIQLTPQQQLAQEQFEVTYEIVTSTEQLIAKALTRHVCIEPIKRIRKELPPEMRDWVEQWGLTKT